MQNKEELTRAAAHWDKVSATRGAPGRNRWWQHPRILSHISTRICGQPYPDLADAIAAKIKAHPAFCGPMRALSIGCGTGLKEMRLIENGVASSFDLYEISPVRIEQGRQLAKTRGLANKVNYLSASPLDNPALSNQYDLVYWDNSLHHMLDAGAALASSKKVLRGGGMLFLNDFVGPSRFQWTSFNQSIADDVRKLLPARFFHNAANPANPIPLPADRLSVERMIALDPTEAADSSSILPALKKHFPDAEVILTGGCIYHIGLNDILANFEDGKDDTILDLLLFLDDMCVALNQTHYALAIAIKK